MNEQMVKQWIFLLDATYTPSSVYLWKGQQIAPTVRESPNAAMTLISAAFTNSTRPGNERKDCEEETEREM